MIFLLIFCLLFGMMVGLTAFLQAEDGGWRIFAAIAVLFMAAYALPEAFLDQTLVIGQLLHPALTIGVALLGCSVLMLGGAIIGQIFRRRLAPLTLGTRTTLITSLLFVVGILWRFA